jgi:hypothetical protein
MLWSLCGRAWCAAKCLSRSGVLPAAACALLLAACNLEDHPGALSGQTRGATVAFESIDGLPSGQFRELVQALNDEAQTHQVAVMSRESPSAYRVRGYLSAKVARRETTISWVWDVFDGDDRRALRITGEETAKSGSSGRRRDAWSAADGAMLQRIAHSSMDQLAAFLTSPEVAPGLPDAAPQTVAFGPGNASPEAAGIYRIIQPNADPVPNEDAEPADRAKAVPLPPRRPPVATVVSARDTPMLTAANP